MLYQLAMYALSQEEQRSATILYPTTAVDAKPQVIAIKEPVHGLQQARVILRPVHLETLESVVWATGMTAVRQRRQLAHWLAFGDMETASV